MVRVKGLEPSRLAAPEPKSGASANFATPAHGLYIVSCAKAQPHKIQTLSTNIKNNIFYLKLLLLLHYHTLD